MVYNILYNTKFHILYNIWKWPLQLPWQKFHPFNRFWHRKVLQQAIQFLSVDARQTLQQCSKHNVYIITRGGGARHIFVKSLVLPVSSIHRVHWKWRLNGGRLGRQGRSCPSKNVCQVGSFVCYTRNVSLRSMYWYVIYHAIYHWYVLYNRC